MLWSPPFFPANSASSGTDGNFLFLAGLNQAKVGDDDESDVGAKGKEEKGRRVIQRWRDFLVPHWLLVVAVAGIDQATGRESPGYQRRSTQSTTEACRSEGEGMTESTGDRNRARKI